jgi:hypothetical protein
MPRLGQKIEELTNMQQDVLNMIKELGGKATSYQIRLHARRTRPTYGASDYFQVNLDNRIQQLRKRGLIKYDPTSAKWYILTKDSGK